jgi:hypothetical protein
MLTQVFEATIIGTNGVKQNFSFTSRLWEDCVSQMGGLPPNTKATLVRVGNQVKNYGLNPNTELPEGNGGYLIALTQERMKGAVDVYFTAEDVADMAHREMVTTCRDLRTQALNTDNNSVLELLGNYTNKTTHELRNVLFEVVKMFTVVEDTIINNTDVAELQKSVKKLEERVLRIETIFAIPSEEFIATL